MSILINHCFSIGYRCNTDDFMKSIGIRKYSSPFSYMVCDLKTSLDFIESKFKDFTNVIVKKNNNHNYLWNGRYWGHDLFFNVKFIPNNDYMSINTMQRVCCWNHHNLEDEMVINTINRRCDRLLNALNSNGNTLLIYIENLQIYNDENWLSYLKIDILLKFLKNKPNCYMLILIPLLNYDKDNILLKINNFINVIFHKSNANVNGNDFGDNTIPWASIQQFTLENYTFNIDNLLEDD